MPVSLPGRTKDEFDTPTLCVDLDQFERNLHFMAGTVRTGGKLWRPHAKGHKTPVVAWKQIAAGAIGVTCAKISEAEIFAAAGIRDILVANVVAGVAKCARLAALCRSADPIICCDHYAQAEPIAAACRSLGVRCRVLVDVNIGMNRTGITPGADAVELAQAIAKLDGLELVGIMGYEGHLLKVADPADKQRQIRASLAILEHCRDLFVKHGLRCDIVSAGGTGSVSITSQAPGVTELQSGGGVFGDPFYSEDCHLTGDFAPALTVMTTVISRPTLERAVLDAGKKAVNPDLHAPQVKDHSYAVITWMSAEHTVLQLGPRSQDLRIGDRLELIVGYHDLTTPLHDEFAAFRGNRLEAVWPILARGKLQ